MVDDDSRLVSLVESIGEHGLCFLDELIREVGPLESKRHGESARREGGRVRVREGGKESEREREVLLTDC